MARRHSLGTNARRTAAVLGAAALGLASLAAVPAGAGGNPTVQFAYTGEPVTYAVPADGSVCSITTDVAGANGGTSRGDSGGGGSADGGIGGTATATFSVLPGDVLTVVVGGAGGNGDADSKAGGFGGGGDGGNGPIIGGNLRGGGGGGATTVLRNGSPLIVAGGGGGGGAYQISGGDGGSAGGDGADGEFTSTSTEGKSGDGGTTTGGGAGGTGGTGDPGPGLPGTAGTAFQGGTGGDGVPGVEDGPGGGGGGGGGYFGGGGGGGAAQGDTGGGGGGGAGYIDPSGTDTGTSTITQDDAGNGDAAFTLGEGCNALFVEKQVSGSVPTGTTFTVHVECTQGESADLTFDETGAPLGERGLQVEQESDCTVTETVTGGATGTTYTCTDTHEAPAAAQCQSDPQKVSFGDGIEQVATVSVSNVFPTAVEPTFTG